MFTTHNGIKSECFIWSLGLVLVFWCHRKYPFVRYPSALRGVFLPLLPCTTLQLLQAHHLPWWPMETSLLWHIQQIKVKCQTMQCMLPSTINSPGCLPQSRGPRLSKTIRSMPPSMCLEHFWLVMDLMYRWKCWLKNVQQTSMHWCHGTGKEDKRSTTLQKRESCGHIDAKYSYFKLTWLEQKQLCFLFAWVLTFISCYFSCYFSTHSNFIYVTWNCFFFFTYLTLLAKTLAVV